MSDSQREMAGGLEKGFGASNVQEHKALRLKTAYQQKPRLEPAHASICRNLPGLLGKWEIPINTFSIIYGTCIAIFLPFPSTQPVTAENMNYGASVFEAALLFAVVDWFVRGHKKSKGPTIRMAHK
ncbi:uncharacterized protein BDW43DRAFT_313170 [Aspergillus alliaceus]|uniref:uncharacterized protein n=1 Tax=Petromyces alliaceus TaxID=209559 RepID=UPI0012A41E1A|nr:uncharacterized protein BDW43DRAFT_313170 [Aspergillus alliaceus]KAB8231358.1 hypothetical protein BDW43DRAFT_313170 [Aspergillus alliaceus]